MWSHLPFYHFYHVAASRVCFCICRQPIDSADLDAAEVSRPKVLAPTRALYTVVLDRLIEHSDKYNDTDLKTYLLSKPVTVIAHNSGRRRYTSKQPVTHIHPASYCSRSCYVRLQVHLFGRK